MHSQTSDEIFCVLQKNRFYDKLANSSVCANTKSVQLQPLTRGCPLDLAGGCAPRPPVSCWLTRLPCGPQLWLCIRQRLLISVDCSCSKYCGQSADPSLWTNITCHLILLLPSDVFNTYIISICCQVSSD